jgi:hypothetical protein
VATNSTYLDVVRRTSKFEQEASEDIHFSRSYTYKDS